MHDVLQHLLDALAALTPLSPSPLPTFSTPAATPSAPSDRAVEVAIVTAIGVVLAAAITALASTVQRERSARSTVPSNDTFTRDYVHGLVQDRRDLVKLRKIHAHLREACLERGIDPDQLIREQERDDTPRPDPR